jgi:TolB protein
VALTVTASAQRQSAVEIITTGRADTRIGVAIPNFAAEPAVQSYAPALAQVLANDLDFTGLFIVVPPNNYPPGFSGLPVDASRIDLVPWRSTPAELLVHGLVRNEGNVLVSESRLYDVPEGSQVIGKRLRAEPQWSRLLAHQFADEIVRQMTGVAGIASTEIVFSGGQSQKKEIYFADYDAGKVTQVTQHGSISIRPKISPDGQRIAYMSYKDRYPWIYVYDRRTGASAVFSKRPGLNHAPTWSPDGNHLLFVLSKDGNTEIYRKNLDGSNEQRITRNSAGDTGPQYSPDGAQIVFVSDREGRPQVYVMGADGSAQRRISFQGGSAYDPTWSPDGRMIAYIVEKDGEGLELWVMNADGSGARPLTQSMGSNESPTFSPDSRHVMFHSSRTGRAQLYTATVETGVIRLVPNLSHMTCEGPSWGPRRQ